MSGFVTALVALFTTGVAHLHAVQDADSCHLSATSQPAAAVERCTAAIDSGQLPSDELGAAFSDRCAAYYGLRRWDKAAADCDAAIRLRPRDAEAFGRRGTVYGATNDYEHALGD